MMYILPLGPWTHIDYGHDMRASKAQGRPHVDAVDADAMRQKAAKKPHWEQAAYRVEISAEGLKSLQRAAKKGMPGAAPAVVSSQQLSARKARGLLKHHVDAVAGTGFVSVEKIRGMGRLHKAEFSAPSVAPTEGTFSLRGAEGLRLTARHRPERPERAQGLNEHRISALSHSRGHQQEDRPSVDVRKLVGAIKL